MSLKSLTKLSHQDSFFLCFCHRADMAFVANAHGM